MANYPVATWGTATKSIIFEMLLISNLSIVVYFSLSVTYGGMNRVYSQRDVPPVGFFVLRPDESVSDLLQNRSDWPNRS